MNTHHTPIITPDASGYAVSCSLGCKLGTTAHQPDRERAEVRAALHLAAATIGTLDAKLDSGEHLTAADERAYNEATTAIVQHVATGGAL